jgi:uncharacterized membrane protein YfcA
MIVDPVFYAIAVPVLLVTGISKGGFGAGIGTLAAPLMSLVIAPTQAAAIMLPILCLMDLFGLWAYWRRWDRVNLRIIMPGALIGIALGTLTFGMLDDRWIGLAIGALAVAFALDWWLRRGIDRPARAPDAWRGTLWSSVSGWTSFVAHAGGPPLGVYLLPQRMDKTLYVGTTVLYFTFVNYLKILPYAWLGLLSPGNLSTSAALIPLAPAGMFLGVWLHGRVKPEPFYRVCYLFVLAAGVKLVADNSGILW